VCELVFGTAEVGMDPEYYDRQADQERKRLESHQKKIAQADAELAKAEAAADKADAAAQKATSASQARSKQSEANRHRAAAAKARTARAKASKAVSESQKKLGDYETRARDGRAKLDKKERDALKRADDHARRDAAKARQQLERESRAQAAREAAREREVIELRERTDELDGRLRAARLAAPKTVTVLFLAGTIEGGELPLRLDREIHEIDQKLRASEYREQVRFETQQATQIRDIIDALNRFDPEIVHFSAHGDRSSLLFEGPDGRPQSLSDDQLALLLQVARKPIRLVVFNACLSAEQAALATDYVDVAIGMEEAINDDTAKVFAGQLYGSLAAGNSIGNAFDQAAAQARVLNEDPLGRPRLYVRDGVDPAEMVLVAP
jgi:hypothetical protein